MTCWTIRKSRPATWSLEALAVEPGAIVDDVLSLFWQRADTKGLELAADIAADVPAVIEGDPTRLNQILSNLVNNALKFTETGSVHVTIRRLDRPAGSDQAELEFAVHDTGIGIPQNKIDQVFDSFSQVDQSTTRNYGGTGLGLPICKRLVNAMGGEIWATSTYGEGATFRFVLPVAIVSDAEPVKALSEPSEKSALVAVPAGPSADVIEKCFADHNIAVTWASPDAGQLPERNDFDYFVAAPEAIAALPPSAENAYNVVISQIGDFAADRLIEKGHAHELLMRPISSRACRAVIERLIDHKPRGLDLLAGDRRQVADYPSFEGLDVLVADDSAVNREVIVQALRRLDVVPDVVENGLQALASAKAKTYDIILMDGSMPEMDGFDAARLIREDEAARRAKPVPIIALTAHVAGDAAHAWKDCGMNARVLKPFTIEELTNCFVEWCGPAQQPSSGTNPVTEQPAFDKTADSPRTEPVFDTTVLDNLREIAGDLGGQMLERLFSIYRDNAPAALANLDDACAGGALTRISTAAHALKSMSGNIGAARLSRSCERLEHETEAGEGGNVAVLQTEIHREFASVMAEIDRYGQPGEADTAELRLEA